MCVYRVGGVCAREGGGRVGEKGKRIEHVVWRGVCLKHDLHSLS